MNLSKNKQLERPNFDRIVTLGSMGNIYNMIGDRLKDDPHIGVCNSSIERAEHLYMIQDYCQTNAFNRSQASTGHE